ncbi:hypothetical protein E2C01_086826 [Portunus trituberculatus]|uniref:Uncharacterized protein n=1 Tax=Portunus trituberculatus TaxID=210409 RepID=A0A5B7JFP3_PORTR|nr:hypothetical protein [Portunus trituberculatus]
MPRAGPRQARLACGHFTLELRFFEHDVQNFTIRKPKAIYSSVLCQARPGRLGGKKVQESPGWPRSSDSRKGQKRTDPDTR